jgi:hypothetical protein
MSLVLAASWARAAPTYVQSACLQVNITTVGTVVLPDAGSSGDLFVFAVEWSYADAGVAVSDTLGDPFVATTPINRAGGGATSQQVWYAVAGASGPVAFTATFSGTVTAGLFVHEYSGIDPGAPLLGAMAMIGSGITPAAGPLNVSANGALLFVEGDDVGNIASVAPPYVLRQTCWGDVTADAFAGDAGDYSVQFTGQAANDWIASIAAFRPASPLSDGGAPVGGAKDYALGCDCSSAGSGSAVWALGLLAVLKGFPTPGPRRPRRWCR